MNTNNISINVTVILFYFFLLAMYFSKKNMDNIENKLYRQMLIWNAFLVLIHFAWLFIGDVFREYPLVIQLTVNIFEDCLILWTFYLSYYFFIVSNEKNEKVLNFYNTNKNKINKILYTIVVIYLIIELFMPTTATYDEVTGVLQTSYGINILVAYVFIIISLIIIIISLIKNRKNLNKKKVFPVIIIFIMFILSIIFSSFFPSICVTIVMTSLVNYLMYHTIENPDVHLITELTLAKTQAEQAFNAKSDFLSSMSHELRTPLNAIVGLSSMIKDTSTDSSSRDDATDIYKASKNLLELVDGILDINKLEANEMEIINEDYSPSELFNDISSAIPLRLGDKKLDIKTRISEDLPNTLSGDKDKIRTIINNLISNAIKYTDVGHVEFAVDCLCVKDNCNLRITVSDTGRGISEEAMQYMFTKFYRREEDKDSDIEGTGLGLAITKSLVDLMDGKISINSTEGIGSTFTITLNQKIVEDKKIQVEELI